jgi:hypothetical protein
MAKRLFTVLNQTFTAQTVTTALTNATYAAFKGGSGTQLTDFLEIEVSGKETASVVSAIGCYRASTIETTPTALAAPNHDGPMNPATAALAAPPVTFVAAATGPQASATVADAVLNLAINLFGGIYRWNAAPTQQWSVLGNTASLGESIIFNSSTAGGSSGKADLDVIYEPY